MDSLWQWLETSSLSVTLRAGTWGYPIVESIHILALAVLFGSVLMFDLRLLGYSRHLLVTDLARHLLPWTYISFAIALISGGILFSVEATQIAANPAFRLKLLLITLAGINVIWFYQSSYRSVRLWNRATPAPIAARINAVMSIGLWAGVIICGRLIAYL
jgi:hypothetical protein